MIKPLLLALLLSLYSANSYSLQSAASGPVGTDAVNSPALASLAMIRGRYVRSILPNGSAAIKYLHQEGAQYVATLRPDGSWPDIDYTDAMRSRWGAAEHLSRVLLMAKSARVYRDAGRPDAALEATILLALKWWTDHDYRNPNWWWNQIGVPQLLGQIGNLMLPQLSADELAKMVAIMKRSNWRRVPWTGANLTWGVAIEIARGCMENDPAPVAEGYARMYEEIKIVSQPEDGIQQDYSFHQHGQQLYNGGYGLDLANDVGRFVSYAWGTQFQIPADRMAIFSSYLLNGERWFIRGPGDEFDYSSVGREITRAQKAPSDGDQTRGPISPGIGAVYGLAHTLALLAAEPTPRQKELEAFAARVRGDANVAAFTGNKQFWCSDYMAQRRRDYFTSVKMLSTRMLNAELVNSEGKESVHLSDGVNFLYLTGDEYMNIFPVWDWTKIPGTTAIQGTLETGEPNPIHARGKTSFDGGVSDGTYGMAAMNLERGNLTAKKAWFFLDRSYMALGAGITLADDTEHGVATDVNQPLLEGAVLTSQSRGPLPEGTYNYDTSGRAYVYHDHVGYIFPPGTKVHLSLGPQSGRWTDIGTGSNAPVTMKVFDLWIDNGKSPQNASYEYTIFPDVNVHEVEQRAKSTDVAVLSNTAEIQAVYNLRLKLAEIAFRKPGWLKTPVGEVKADHACLLLVTRGRHEWKVTASNPENQSLILSVAVQEKSITIGLPGGNFAGSSVTKRIPVL